MKKAAIGISLFIIASVAILAYLASIIFSENVYYQKGSLEYCLLTQEIIKELPLETQAEAKFFYSSADGNKPAKNTVEFSGTISDSILSDYFSSNQYELIENGSYKKDSQEVIVEYIGPDKNRIKITVLDYLR